MFFGCKHPDIVSQLILVDIVPKSNVGVTLFPAYIRYMRQIERAKIRSRQEADAMLAAGEPVILVFVFGSFMLPTNHFGRHSIDAFGTPVFADEFGLERC